MPIVTNRPDWFRAALEVQEPAVPNFVFDDGIVPTVDAYQNGWALAEYNFLRVDLGPSSPPVNQIVLPRDDTRIQVLLEMEVDNEQSTDTWDFFLRLVDPVPATPSVIKVTRPPAASRPIPANTLVPSRDLIDGRSIIIPPRWQLEAFFDGTGVGSTKTTRTHWVAFPVGFKPI